MDSPILHLTDRPLQSDARAVSSLFHRNPQWAIALAALVLAAAFPSLAIATGHGFYVGFATRVLIYVMAVTSLNLLVGYGGLVSFGHAAYLGIGAYTVAALHLAAGSMLPAWATSAWIAWPCAMLAGALLALLIGAVALRTRQIYFIMVTLAFSQMVYYLFVGMSSFGSDNGMSLPHRSPIGLGLDLGNDSVFYYVVLTLTAGTLGLLTMTVRSRFGLVIRGIAENESRMAAIGYPVYRYKLICFVIGGAFAGLAGALLANQSSFVSPRLLDWVQSGNLLLMLILGGVGYKAGGIYGAATMLILEEVLSGYTEFWAFFVGVGVIVVVLLGNNGIASLLEKLSGRKDLT